MRKRLAARYCACLKLAPNQVVMSKSVNMSIEAHGNSQAMHRTGLILSGIVIAFMAADAGSTLLAIAPIKKAALETGYPLDQMWLIGSARWRSSASHSTRSRPPACSGRSS